MSRLKTIPVNFKVNSFENYQRSNRKIVQVYS